MFSKSDFKTSLEVKVDKKTFGVDTVYLVPSNKNYNRIKPNANFNAEGKKIIAYLQLGNPSYNGLLKVYDDFTFSQYRDGCFHEYG